MNDRALPIVKPTDVFRHGAIQRQLNIVEYGEITKPAEVHKVIVESVKKTQFPIFLGDLPSWILMTHRQFVELLPYTAEMMYTEGRIYITPYNVMEVEVLEGADDVGEDEVLQTFDPAVEAFEREQQLINTQQLEGNSRWSR